MGILAYDRGFFSTDDFSGTVIDAEFLFRSPVFWLASARRVPIFGFDAAITDDPVHFFYAGLNWDFQNCRGGQEKLH